MEQRKKIPTMFRRASIQFKFKERETQANDPHTTTTMYYDRVHVYLHVLLYFHMNYQKPVVRVFSLSVAELLVLLLFI